MAHPPQKPEWLSDHIPAPPPEAGESSTASSRQSAAQPTASTPAKSGPPIKIASSPSGPKPSATPVMVGTAAEELVPKVRYFRKGYRERVYPLVVELSASQGQPEHPLPTGTTVEVRPLLPGTMVWPEKLVLQREQRVARFWVMPVATGRLREGYVSINSNGDSAQRIPVPMKVRRGRGWFFWLCVWLTILVPIGLFVLRCLPPEAVTLQYTAMRTSPQTGQDLPMPYQGRKAVEAWLEDVYNKAVAVPAEDRSVRQWLMVLLGNTGDLLPEAYDVYETMLQETMLAEPLALGVLLFLTLVVGWWTGPKRTYLVGKPIRVTA